MQSGPASIVIALGSNLGDRTRHLRQAVDELSRVIRIARVSSIYRTEPIDCEPEAPDFFNMVVLGFTRLSPWQVLQHGLEIERRMGRAVQARSGLSRSRSIDIDLVFYSSKLARHRSLQIPHPRFRAREFVLAPLRELELPWIDPATMTSLDEIKGTGKVERVGSLY